MPYRWPLHEGRRVNVYLDRAQPTAEWPMYRTARTQVLIFGEGAQCQVSWIEHGTRRSREVSGHAVCLVGTSVALRLDWQRSAPLMMLYVEPALAHEVLGRALRGVSFFDYTLVAMHDLQALQWMHLLARMGQPQRAVDRLYLECVSTVLAVHLLGVSNLTAKSFAGQSAKLSSESFNRIHIFITENLTDKITLDQLAKIAALSRSHFVRLFKGAAGMSPYHYVVRQRVLRACALLRETEQRITDIGFAVGFNDVADFNHMFKKFMQCSPRQFRKMSHPIFPV